MCVCILKTSEGVYAKSSCSCFFVLSVCVCYRYLVNSIISKRVGNLNPAWNEAISNEEIDVR